LPLDPIKGGAFEIPYFSWLGRWPSIGIGLLAGAAGIHAMIAHWNAWCWRKDVRASPMIMACGASKARK
jgi:hypothetical protein